VGYPRKWTRSIFSLVQPYFWQSPAHVRYHMGTLHVTGQPVGFLKWRQAIIPSYHPKLSCGWETNSIRSSSWLPMPNSRNMDSHSCHSSLAKKFPHWPLDSLTEAEALDDTTIPAGSAGSRLILRADTHRRGKPMGKPLWKMIDMHLSTSNICLFAGGYNT